MKVVLWPKDVDKVYGYIMCRSFFFQFDTEQDEQAFVEKQKTIDPQWDYDGYVAFRITKQTASFEELHKSWVKLRGVSEV